MATDSKRNDNDMDNDEGFVGKRFNNMRFKPTDDRFNVVIEYDRNSELLSISLTNLRSKDLFRSDFDRERIHSITDGCKLQSDLVVKMLIDTLQSNSLTSKNIRLFHFESSKIGDAKSDQFRRLKSIPHQTSPSRLHETDDDEDSVSDASASDDDNAAAAHSKPVDNHCVVLVLHFKAPPYISFNYCFTVRGVFVSASERLGLKIADLEKENHGLRKMVSRHSEQISNLFQRVDQLSEINGVLTQRFLLQEIEAETKEKEMADGMNSNMGAAEEPKQRRTENQNSRGSSRANSSLSSSSCVEEMALVLKNQWRRYDETWSRAKAVKIGRVVYLNGLVKDGTKGHIATLPKGWRPSKQKMFAQCSNQNGNTTRVDVLADGRVFLFVTQSMSFLSLEGMSFVVGIS